MNWETPTHLHGLYWFRVTWYQSQHWTTRFRRTLGCESVKPCSLKDISPDLSHPPYSWLKKEVETKAQRRRLAGWLLGNNRTRSGIKCPCPPEWGCYLLGIPGALAPVKLAEQHYLISAKDPAGRRTEAGDRGPVTSDVPAVERSNRGHLGSSKQNNDSS